MGNPPFLQTLGMEHPIIQAPMGGGPSTPELVAAVTNAGGLGSLAGAYLSPEQITQEIRHTRELTSKAFSVNLFAGGYQERDDSDAAPMMAHLRQIHSQLGIPPPALPTVPPDPFREQLEALLAANVPIFSFTFGIPQPGVLRRVKARGIKIFGTATTLEEARLLAAAGVDAIVAQGEEAGAHRGSFAKPMEASVVPTADLVQQIAGAMQLPVVASGGVMDGGDIARMLRLGAVAVQMGTAFIPCPESAAAEIYKRTLLSAVDDRTGITRAFSGRAARGISNVFTESMAGKESSILSFPLQNTLTREMRKAAAKRNNPEYLSLWAGRGVARARSMLAAELIKALVAEMAAAG